MEAFTAELVGTMILVILGDLDLPGDRTCWLQPDVGHRAGVRDRERVVCEDRVQGHVGRNVQRVDVVVSHGSPYRCLIAKKEARQTRPADAPEAVDPVRCSPLLQIIETLPFVPRSLSSWLS